MRSRFDEDGNPDIKVVVAQYRDAMRKKFRWLGPAIGGGIILVLLLSGLYSVEPGEVGVVRTFGKETGQMQPGLHFALPIAQRYDIVNVSKIRRAEIGFRGSKGGVTKRVDHEALMLTGDENIVEAQMIVQFLISDPSRYLFRLNDPEKVLHVAAEVALRGVVGQINIDDVLTTGREQAQTRTKEAMQKLMDLYESGLRITEVKLQVVDAPDEVKDAFHDVVRAREEKEKTINKAKGYYEDRIPKARGEAQKIERAAEAYKEQRILKAKGDSANYLKVLAEYQKAKDVTRERLHLETMERIFKNTPKKVFIDSAVAERSIPILPLGGVIGAGAVKDGGGQ